jgi:ATP-dependent RNA helicase DeaD
VPDGGYAFEDDGQQTTWRLAVGRRHGAEPGNIVGAIANEARLHGSQINGVDIRADYSMVRLPANLPEAVIARLSKVRIRGQELALSANTMPTKREKPKAHRKGPKGPRD